MRLIFRDGRIADDKYVNIDTLMVNRDRGIVLNPMEDLDEEEKLAVLTDMLTANPLQNDVNIVKQVWSPVIDFWTSNH